MTEAARRKLLRSALGELEHTGQGYIQWTRGGRKGGHWKRALDELHTLERDLAPDLVPALGPIWHGGKSVLLHDLTHSTAGIPLYPAFDDAFREGEVIIAPEALTVCKHLTSSNPGHAIYACGRSEIVYWFGHLDRAHALGTKFGKGDAIGKVARNTIGGGPHCHVGINIEALAGKGKQLAHHTDYTHGAPLIGTQLRKILA